MRCFIKDDQPDMNRQIEFIIKQLNSSKKCMHMGVCTKYMYCTYLCNYPCVKIIMCVCVVTMVTADEPEEAESDDEDEDEDEVCSQMLMHHT